MLFRSKRTKSGARRSPPLSHQRAPPAAPLQVPVNPPPPQVGGQATGSFPPLHSCLVFRDGRYKAKVSNLLPLPIEPSRYPSQSALERLGVWDDISDRLTRGHWLDLLTVRDPCYRELLVEFLSSFRMDKKGLIDVFKPDIIRFRLGGTQFSFSISAFGVQLGLYSPTFVTTDEYRQSLLDFPDRTTGEAFWIAHSRPGHTHYEPTRSKSTGLVSPVLRILHRIIAHSICGRRESTGVVTRRDLFYLYCLETRQPCNLAYGMAHYFDLMGGKSRGALCGGHYITRLARRLDVFGALSGLSQGIHLSVIDLDALRSMRVVEKRGDAYFLLDVPPPGADDDDAPVHDPPAPSIPPPVHDSADTSVPPMAPQDDIPMPDVPPPSADHWRRHEEMLQHLYYHMDYQSRALALLLHDRGIVPPDYPPPPPPYFQPPPFAGSSSAFSRSSEPFPPVPPLDPTFNLEATEDSNDEE